MRLNKFLVITFLFGGVFALLTKQQLASTALPTGLITQTAPIDSSVFISPAPITGRPLVTLSTTKGVITFELRPDLSPNNTLKVLAHLNLQSCNQTQIRKSSDWFIHICDLFSPSTDSPVEDSSTPLSAGSLFITDTRLTIVREDFSPLPSEYTYLGKVISGMEIIAKLSEGDKVISSAILSK